MIILHYIPTLTKSMQQAAAFVQQLHVAMGRTVESHLYSGKLSRKEFLRKLDTLRPDVVHLHGCWNAHLAFIQFIATRQGYPVVLSPHGGLMQKVMHTDFWKKRLPQTVLYQFHAVHNAFVIHASTAAELQELKQLGWKRRIALIPNPNDVETFRTFYQKVIDTATRYKLIAVEQHAVWELLYADCLARHATAPKHTPGLSAPLHTIAPTIPETLSSHNWKKIQTFALDHGINDVIMRSARTCNITVLGIVSELPSRYKVKETLRITTTSSLERKLSQRYATNNAELAIAQTIYSLYLTLCKHQMRDEWQPLISRIVSVYEQLQWGDCNEQILCRIISDFGISSFCARLMHVLSQRLHLSIGFMPLDPVVDKQTIALYNQINITP